MKKIALAVATILIVSVGTSFAGKTSGASVACLNGSFVVTPASVRNGSGLVLLNASFSEPDHDNDTIGMLIESISMNEANCGELVDWAFSPETILAIDTRVAIASFELLGFRCGSTQRLYTITATCSDEDVVTYPTFTVGRSQTVQVKVPVTK